MDEDLFHIPGNPHSVSVLKEGYCYKDRHGRTRAEGTVSLITGPCSIVVDTGGPWSTQELANALFKRGVTHESVPWVVVTHGHLDHAGGLALFPRSKIVMGGDVSDGPASFTAHDFGMDGPLVLTPGVQVISTPGHTAEDVSVLVSGTRHGTVLIAGDLFEREHDDEDEPGPDETTRPSWRTSSFDQDLHVANRERALMLADVIVPGHGPPFLVKKS
uniref:metallo-beta-lactamase domain-containing protein 1-like n=1 Tax=Myxine glutinosa TaxID=7769 RepID=UPI00358E1D7D